MKKITFDDVFRWLGTDATLDEAICTIRDISNKDYPVKDLIKDILDYNKKE